MLDAAAVLGRTFPVLRQAYTEKDAILYALALGYGLDPVDEAQLRYAYERGLRVVPTFANVLCHPGFWISDPSTGIDATRTVHGEHRMRFHAPLPPSGVVRGALRVTGLIDKGPGKGALLVTERTLHDDASGALLASIEQHTFCRGDGGFSGVTPSSEPTRRQSSPPMPERTPDHVVELATLPHAALLYRLSADLNPLHADPAAARSAGFARPILHGLCTFGIISRAVLQACADDQPGQLLSLGGRFSAPVFPGETLRVEIWRETAHQGVQNLRLRCLVPARQTVVFSNGDAQVAAARPRDQDAPPTTLNDRP